ncbi:TRAP transporter small permease [Amaricoccus solimangrovi]|uniref:TRAP transporter small permease protein n=1 Tax=Amaricoccus solimangrovi TaxID=2589815 RepID=A0A501WEZ9_9RHOB|nr:TRAP transporter small permease [Amaricoccus solimangrovi]TPE46644.1 TRAP transporter small permease [Amaricoccus solimangrovi]
MAPHSEVRAGVPVEAGVLGRVVEKGALPVALGIVAAALILLMEVFLRYVLNAPTIWAHETGTFLCAAAFLYGGLLCVSRDSHIRVILVYQTMPPAIQRVLDVLISIASAAASGFFAWAAWMMVAKAVWMPAGGVRLERSGSAWDPPLPAYLKILLFLTLIAMTVQFAIYAVNQVRKLGSQ